MLSASLNLIFAELDDVEEVIRDGSEGLRSGRWISRMLGDVDMERVGWSGGTNTPSWRKDLTFVMRIREEAEGERRMMGSVWALLLCFLGMERPEEGVGIRGVLFPGRGLVLVPGAGLRLRPRKVSAVLRTCEKSCFISCILHSRVRADVP